MLPSVVQSLLQSLPDANDARELLPKLQEIKTKLTAASAGSQPLSDEVQETFVRRLDRALSAWRQKKQAASQFNSLCGHYEVARSLDTSIRTLQAELDARLAIDAKELMQQFKANLLGTGSLLEIPPRQLELMSQVLEPVIARMTADRLTPPLQRSVADEALATMTDDALEMLPTEDNVVSATRRMVGAIVRFAKSFQQPTVEIVGDQIKTLTTELKRLVDCHQQLEETAYDICELVHDHQLLDTQKLSEKNQKFFEFLFPSEIITLEPTEEMRGAWREAALERQIKSDMDDTLSDCIRSHPVANALMAQYAQTKDLKLYDQARQLVLPDARKKLEVRLATAILNKATDEIEQREAMHRYPVEITEDIKTKITAGDLVAAMQVIEIAALQLMKHFLPELYRSNFTIEQ